MDRGLYRRRQRRRAIVGWSALGLVVALVALVAIFGGGVHVRGNFEEGSVGSGSASIFGSEMTSRQYEALHKGEPETVILEEIHNVGLREGQVEDSSLLGLFPARPDRSTCSYWTLSDAPGHLVRLCFSDPQGVLLQKAVAAEGEGTPRAEETSA